MCDEYKESSQISGNLLLYPLSDRYSLQKFEELEELCNKHSQEKSSNFAKINCQVKTISQFEYKFRNCLEFLYLTGDYPETLKEGGEYNFVDVFFRFVKRGFGIAQIVGPSGSGKTSISLRAAHNFSGTVLYLDTNGSFDPSKAPKNTNFIPLRLYTCEELNLFLSDFENRLSNDRLLYESLDLKARSVEMLIVDSLWCFDQIDKYRRHEFLFNLSVVLRRISWKYDISVIVCVNYNNKPNKTKKETENKEIETKNSYGWYHKNIFKKWNCNCYVQFLLSYKTLNYKADTQNSQELEGPPVYRIMQISSGTLNEKFKFVINHENILLEDI